MVVQRGPSDGRGASPPMGPAVGDLKRIDAESRLCVRGGRGSADALGAGLLTPPMAGPKVSRRQGANRRIPDINQKIISWARLMGAAILSLFRERPIGPDGKAGFGIVPGRVQPTERKAG